MIKIFKNCSKKFTYILKRMRFSLYICHYANFFFSLVLKLCFWTIKSLFKEHLISNSNERVGLEEED